MKDHKEQLEEIVDKLQNHRSDFPSFWLLRGMYLVKYSRKLREFEKAHYRMLLNDYYREYHRKHNF